MTATASSSPVRRRRRGRLLVWLLLAVLFLAVVLVVVDRIAVKVVEHRLAARIQTSQQFSARPDVTIHGFPFLTQVLAGKYGHVTLQARSPITEQGVELTNADVEMHGVTVKTSDALNGRVSTLPVRSGTGSAFISYAAITTALNKDTSSLGVALSIKGGAPGHATISGPFGLSLGVKAKVTDGQLTVTADPSDIAQLPALVQPLVTSALQNPIRLPPFPFNVTLSSAQLEPTGVELQAVAHNATFPI